MIEDKIYIYNFKDENIEKIIKTILKNLKYFQNRCQKPKISFFTIHPVQFEPSLKHIFKIAKINLFKTLKKKFKKAIFFFSN